MCIHEQPVRRACRRHCRNSLVGVYALVVGTFAYMLVGTILLSALSAISGGFVPSQLYQAASINDVVGVEALLQKDQSPDSPAALGVPFGEFLYTQTPLAFAAFENRPELAKALIKAGASTDRGRLQGPLGSISSESPLYSAAVRGNFAALMELLRGGASHSVGQTAGPFGALIWESPLAAATSNGHSKTVSALLKAGADPQVGWIFACGFHVSPVAIAVDGDHITALEALLDAGADPNVGRTYLGGVFTGSPLYYAARDDRLAIAKALLRAGADPLHGLFMAEGLFPALDSPIAVAAELQHKAMEKLLKRSERRHTTHAEAELDSVLDRYGDRETVQPEQAHDAKIGSLQQERELRRRSI